VSGFDHDSQVKAGHHTEGDGSVKLTSSLI
jgi:hypothetical protein